MKIKSYRNKICWVKLTYRRSPILFGEKYWIVTGNGIGKTRVRYNNLDEAYKVYNTIKRLLGD